MHAESGTQMQIINFVIIDVIEGAPLCKLSSTTECAHQINHMHLSFQQ